MSRIRGGARAATHERGRKLWPGCPTGMCLPCHRAGALPALAGRPCTGPRPGLPLLPAQRGDQASTVRSVIGANVCRGPRLRKRRRSGWRLTLLSVTRIVSGLASPPNSRRRSAARSVRGAVAADSFCRRRLTALICLVGSGETACGLEVLWLRISSSVNRS
jgi:hypothetical protein